MIHLTVGYVSGIIAAAIYIVQKFIPTAVVLILVGITAEEESAVTWSVAAQTISNSVWPRILCTDSSASLGVNNKVKFLTWLRPLALAVVAVAAVVTPLGLYETVGTETSPQPVPFPYVADIGPMGYGTPNRSSLGFSRVCGQFLPVACPGSNTVINYSSNDTTSSADLPNGYDTRLPRNLTDLFQSGLANQAQTVSSIFDIEWRTYTFAQDANIDNGAEYLVNSYRQLTSLILNDAVEPVEGLIVDTQEGGIGFRNHTVPTGVELGATWTEDLLFVEPDTQCVDTNLTLDFSIPRGLSEYTIDDLALTDRGGFANLIQHYPEYDRSDPQANPDLKGRAYKAAWMNNANTMLYLNVTRPNPHAWAYLNSTVGQRFPLSATFTGVSFDSLMVKTQWGSYLNLLDSGGAASNFSASLNNTNSTTASSSNNITYANPFQITLDNFTAINTLCQGAGGLDLANITNLAVSCGMVFGAARRSDGTHSLIFAPGTNWTVPLYSCATATKAVIKEVSFSYNGTEGLKSLKIINATEKSYANDDDKPLWGVENTSLTLADTSPLWGLVSPQFQGRSDLSTLRSSHLWLPGYTGLSVGVFTSGYQNLPGIEFHSDALGGAYVTGTGSGTSNLADYSGKSNLAMYAKWQDLSRTSNTTAKIINLIWTDIAANAVIGTRSWLPSSALVGLQQRDIVTNSSISPLQPAAQVPVLIYTNQIHYKYLFAIPAFVVLLLTIILAIATLLLTVFRRARLSKIRHLLNALSPGRIMATFVYPEECDPQAPTKKWAKQVGYRRIIVGSGTPHAPSELLVGKDGTQILMQPLGSSGATSPAMSMGNSYRNPDKMGGQQYDPVHGRPTLVPAYNVIPPQPPGPHGPFAGGFNAHLRSDEASQRHRLDQMGFPQAIQPNSVI